MADSLPVALRRTRRSTSSLSNAFHAGKTGSVPADVLTPPLTPSSSSSKRSSYSSRQSLSSRSIASTPSSRQARRPKRVRFSDPGQRPSSPAEPTTPSTPSCDCSSSTGLTPFVKRVSLQTGLPVSGEVTFLPLRQVLDGRVQRRLRRNGLSEEMNSLHAEKRQKAKAAEVELARLREEVAAKDEQIRWMQTVEDGDPDDTVFQDNDRIMALQREVSVLRRQLAGRPTDVADVDVETPPQDRTFNWTMAARDPFGSTISGVDDDDDMTEVMDARGDGPAMIDVDGNDIFGDATMAELQCSTPSRPRVQRQQAKVDDSQRTISFSMSLGGPGGSFPTPPATSPVAWTDDGGVGADDDDYEGIPLTPVTPSMHLFSTRRPSPVPIAIPTTSDAEVQAMLPDPETVQLRGEVVCLKNVQDGLEERVASLVRDLADKTAALESLSTSLRALMPDTSNDEPRDRPPLDAADIVDRLGAAFRTARLELEYLTPGEIALPLTAPVAEVLDLLLARLRQLSQQAHEADAQIDEYHAIESDLRQQLGARVAAMDALVAEAARKDATMAEQASTVRDLEVGADRFKGALASYARDVAELEAVVQRLEASLQESAAALQDKDAAVTRLTAAHARHGQALALRDARVHELRGEIEQNHATLRASQRSAHEASRQLRADNSDLQAKLAAETQRAAAAKAAVATLQALLETADAVGATEGTRETRLSLGKRLFRRRSAAAATEGVQGTKTAGATEVTPSRSTKTRRRYDSGLGFLDEEEA